MNDAFITAINTQYATVNWIDVITDNMTNIYTPGFKEKQVNFKTFLGGTISDDYAKTWVKVNQLQELLRITYF